MLKGLANISWLSPGQLKELAGGLIVTRHKKRSTIFSEKSSSESAHILLSGVARITCDHRRGRRTTAIMLSPGLIPAFPTSIAGIAYNFRCEAVTSCQVGTMGLNGFVEVCLGIGASPFKLLAGAFLGRWDRVHVRCSNLLGCTLEERLALTLLDLGENFGTLDGRGLMLLTVPVRNVDLAEMIGASRPRVSEHMVEFTQKRMISRKNRRLAIDQKRLIGFLTDSHPEPFSGELL